MIALLALAVGVLVYDNNNDNYYYSGSDEDMIEKAGKVYVFQLHH